MPRRPGVGMPGGEAGGIAQGVPCRQLEDAECSNRGQNRPAALRFNSGSTRSSGESGFPCWASRSLPGGSPPGWAAGQRNPRSRSPPSSALLQANGSAEGLAAGEQLRTAGRAERGSRASAWLWSSAAAPGSGPGPPPRGSGGRSPSLSRAGCGPPSGQQRRKPIPGTPRPLAGSGLPIEPVSPAH